jgi:hypothetical protein
VPFEVGLVTQILVDVAADCLFEEMAEPLRVALVQLPFCPELESRGRYFVSFRKMEGEPAV